MVLMVDAAPEVTSKTPEAEKVMFSTQPQVPISDTTSLIDKADAVAKRIEEANKVAEQLVQRQEAVAARMLLSGRAEAGAQTKTPEQTNQEKIDAEVEKTLKRFK